MPAILGEFVKSCYSRTAREGFGRGPSPRKKAQLKDHVVARQIDLFAPYIACVGPRENNDREICLIELILEGLHVGLAELEHPLLPRPGEQ